MLLRNLSAASHSLASNPMVAVESEVFFCAFPFAMQSRNRKPVTVIGNGKTLELFDFSRDFDVPVILPILKALRQAAFAASINFFFA